MRGVNNKFNCKNKYNMEFKKSGVSFELKGMKNKKRIFISMKNLLSL